MNLTIISPTQDELSSYSIQELEQQYSDTLNSMSGTKEAHPAPAFLDELAQQKEAGQPGRTLPFIFEIKL